MLSLAGDESFIGNEAVAKASVPLDEEEEEDEGAARFLDAAAGVADNDDAVLVLVDLEDEEEDLTCESAVPTPEPAFVLPRAPSKLKGFGARGGFLARGAAAAFFGFVTREAAVGGGGGEGVADPDRNPILPDAAAAAVVAPPPSIRCVSIHWIHSSFLTWMRPRTWPSMSLSPLSSAHCDRCSMRDPKLRLFRAFRQIGHWNDAAWMSGSEAAEADADADAGVEEAGSEEVAGAAVTAVEVDATTGARTVEKRVRVTFFVCERVRLIGCDDAAAAAAALLLAAATLDTDDAAAADA